MSLRAAGRWAVVAVTALCLVGCSSAVARSEEAPELSLSGPWADQFQAAYGRAESVYEKEVLRDGVVTPVEYEQSRNRLRSCLSDSRYTIEWDARGGFSLGAADESYPDDFFEQSDPVLQKCEAAWSGSILYLFEQVRRNPAKQDEAALQVACLKSAGLVDATYAKQRWTHDNERDDFPFDATSKEAVRCSVDPLGIWYAE